MATRSQNSMSLSVASPNGYHSSKPNASPEMRKMEMALEYYKNPTTVTTYRCHYTGCTSDSKYDSSVVMFTVPRTGCRRTIWLKAMGLDESDPRRNLKCCNKHFYSSDKNKCGKLLKSAEPKIYEVPCKPPYAPALPSGSIESSQNNSPVARKVKATETEPTEIPKKRRRKIYGSKEENKENADGNQLSARQSGLVIEIPRKPLKGRSVQHKNFEVKQQQEIEQEDELQPQMTVGLCHKADGSGVESSLHGKKLKNKQPLRGLENLGNTCYMNSMLQAMFSSPLFKAYICSHEHVDGVTHISTGCMSCHLRFVLHNIEKGLHGPFSPSVFVRFIWSFQCFNRGEQECAMKLIQFVLDGIREEEEQSVDIPRLARFRGILNSRTQ